VDVVVPGFKVEIVLARIKERAHVPSVLFHEQDYGMRFFPSLSSSNDGFFMEGASVKEKETRLPRAEIAQILIAQMNN
jgi:hypothetical protein